MSENFKDLGIELEYTADELRKRRVKFLVSLERELEERNQRERKMCSSILKQLISEFNRKAENEFEKTFVMLDETEIPVSLPLKRVIELTTELFAENGFKIQLERVHSRSFLKVSWERLPVEIEPELKKIDPTNLTENES